MKKIILLIAIAAFSTNLNSQTVRTSTKNGAWNDPTVWSPNGVPTPNDSRAEINHQVSYSGHLFMLPDCVVIKTNACLFATNSTDTLTLGSGDGFHNLGYTSTGTFITSGILYNNGDIKVFGDMHQSDDFYNDNNGKLDAGTINTSGTVTNNGEIKCNNFTNSAAMVGNGKMCIANCFINSSSINGTMDICDATTTICDQNVGTIGSSITYCQASPCSGVSSNCTSTSIKEIEKANIKVFPNPARDFITISATSHITSILIVDITGKLIQKIEHSGSNSISINSSLMHSGVYFYTVQVKTGEIMTGKVFIK